jgi:hypothetical protein
MIATVDQTQVQAASQTPTDIFGREIQSGDTVVYATRRGSDTFLNKLFVQTVQPGGISGFNPDDPTRRKRNLTNFSTIARVI